MKSECHVTVAEAVLEMIQKKYGIFLDKENFVYGNTKPDHSLSFLYVRHNIESTFDFVMDNIRALTRRMADCTMNDEELSFQIGIICHYITDYFSWAHNSCFNGGLRKHVMYERTQEKLTSVFLDFVKEKASRYEEERCLSMPELMRVILKKHRAYLAEECRSYMTDFYYAISECCEVVLSIFAIAEGKAVVAKHAFAV